MIDAYAIIDDSREHHECRRRKQPKHAQREHRGGACASQRSAHVNLNLFFLFAVARE